MKVSSNNKFSLDVDFGRPPDKYPIHAITEEIEDINVPIGYRFPSTTIPSEPTVVSPAELIIPGISIPQISNGKQSENQEKVIVKKKHSAKRRPKISSPKPLRPMSPRTTIKKKPKPIQKIKKEIISDQTIHTDQQADEFDILPEDKGFNSMLPSPYGNKRTNSFAKNPECKCFDKNKMNSICDGLLDKMSCKICVERHGVNCPYVQDSKCGNRMSEILASFIVDEDERIGRDERKIAVMLKKIANKARTLAAIIYPEWSREMSGTDAILDEVEYAYFIDPEKAEEEYQIAKLQRESDGPSRNDLESKLKSYRNYTLE